MHTTLVNRWNPQGTAGKGRQLATVFRGPQMGGQIRRGRSWRFWGAPIFRPEIPKPFKNRYLGTSGLKIGAPQKPQILPWRIWPPICGPLKYTTSYDMLWHSTKLYGMLWHFATCCDDLCHFLHSERKNMGHSSLDGFKWIKVQNWISLFQGEMARIQKEEGLIRTPLIAMAQVLPFLIHLKKVIMHHKA